MAFTEGWRRDGVVADSVYTTGRDATSNINSRLRGHVTVRAVEVEALEQVKLNCRRLMPHAKGAKSAKKKETNGFAAFALFA